MRVLYALLPLLCIASPANHNGGADAIVQAINDIESKITVLKNTVSGFNKNNDLQTALTIQHESDMVLFSTQNAAHVAYDSPALNDNDSGKVAIAVLNLVPQIKSLLDKLVRHKPEFQTALGGHSVDAFVQHSLSDSQRASDEFSANLTPKLSLSYQAAAPSVTKQIDGYFAKAIQAFSN